MKAVSTHPHSLVYFSSFSACDPLTDFDTMITVFKHHNTIPATGEPPFDGCPTQFVETQDDLNDFCGFSSLNSGVGFYLHQDESAWILVHGFNGASGHYALHVSNVSNV